MLLRTTIERPPRDEPDKTDRAGDDERGAPAPPKRNHRHHEWRDERADVRSRVEDAGGECAFLLRKPFGNGFDRSGEVSGFTKAEEETSNTEPQHRVGEWMGHRREA